MSNDLFPGAVVRFTAPSRRLLIGVILRVRRVTDEGLSRPVYQVRPFALETRPFIPADVVYLSYQGQLYTPAGGKDLAVYPGGLKPAPSVRPLFSTELANLMKKTRKTTKKAATTKRTSTAKGKAYLTKLDALTKQIHQASYTGETRKVKEYSISIAAAKRAAIKKLKK